MHTEISSVAELPEMHLMGHTCANLNGELLFIWGGSNENVACSSAPNNNLWIYETLTGYIRRRTCGGECPPYLSSCSSALIGQKMYVFGGHSPIQDNWLNSLYCLDLDTFMWRDLGSQARALPSKPIRSDKNVAWSYEKRLYVFGGYGSSQVEHYLELLDCQQDLQLTPDFRWPKFGWNNQLVEYNPEDRTWRWPSYQGKCPSARAAHSGALMGDKFYLFGGRDSHERLNDLYTLDMKIFEWHKIAVVSCSYDASGNPVLNNRLLGAAGDRRAQPIGHLLDDARVQDFDDESLLMDEAAEDENHRQLVEEMHGVEVDDDEEEAEGSRWPIPSSSSAASSLTLIDLQEQHDRQTTNEQLGISAAPNGDEDEDDFEYPHPSHLLERWSLSSWSCSQSEPTNEMRPNSNPNISIDNQHSRQLQLQVGPSEGGQAARESSLRDQQQQQDLDRPSHSDESQPRAQQQQQQQQQQLAASNQERALLPPIEDCANDTIDIGAASRPQLPPVLPTGRSFCSLTPISNDNMLLFGGIDSQDRNLDDCWLFNISSRQWTQISDYKHRRSRLWHTGAATKQNEVVILGGSSSDNIGEYCSDVLVISFEAKSLKRLALDAVSRSVRMKTIHRTNGLPSQLVRLIKLRKQAMTLTMRRSASQRVLLMTSNHSLT